MPAVIDQAPAIDTSLDGAANAFEAILSGDVGENDAEGEEQTTQKGVEDSEPEAEPRPRDRMRMRRPMMRVSLTTNRMTRTSLFIPSK